LGHPVSEQNKAQQSKIKLVLCVKYGLISLLLFDVSQIDFMLESLCTR